MLGLLIGIILILLLKINLIESCNNINSIDIQSAAYSYPIILRVQPTNINHKILLPKNQYHVIVKEIIKMKSSSYIHLQINDIISIFVAPTIIDQNENCWQLLEIIHSNLIVFLTSSTTINSLNFEILYPPIESTIRVRTHIQRVICNSCETYSPQVIVKTLQYKPKLFKSYRLQCNTRGNPQPKVFWSKNNHTKQFHSSKECNSKKCHIFSIQKKYTSYLHFRKFSIDDVGLYTCHAENPMNKTQSSITLVFDSNNPLEDYSKRKNSTCDYLDRCYNRGQCIILEKKLQCLCEKNFFGDRCEHSYEEMVKKHNNELLVFKSRFITTLMLGIVLFLLITLGLVSWLLSRAGKRNIKFQNTPIDVETVEDKDDKIVVQESNHLVESSPSQPLSINILKIHESKENIQPKTSKISAFVNESIIATNKTENTTSKINEHELNPVVHVSLPSSQKSVLIGKPYFTDTSTNDEDDEDEFNDHDEDIILRRARTFSSQKETPINNDEYEERFSLKMNNSELHGLNNDLILTEGYHYCSDDHGLIKPLESSSSLRRMIPPPPPKRFTKYVSSRFLLPTPVNQD